MRYLLPFIMLGLPAFADAPTVDAVNARSTPGGWHFDVTLSHPDTGWDHYADGWEVLAPDGTRLGFRELLHPHVNEQPFTRSLSGVEIPTDMTEVSIRPRCNVDGWGAPVAVQLSR
ncbi:hypothetical protein [Actibacterium lipolyticum]|uniref:Secreted protein n=1 Tax=Actibacterium lipolyticum TaxID=1524263 RepID=A0A238KRQ3_9RHOB|nr:hypothetical protein [Actibacterium lipolyticum]SMX45485.1 hypothetical protein COL8621_02809 [Actibacterium lipolyticum]